MNIDIPLLEKNYFYFDKPVPYTIDDKTLYLKPISLLDSEIFLASMGILTVDKNSWPDVKVIRMSYLDFIYKVLIMENNDNAYRLAVILKLCLDIDDPTVIFNDGGKISLQSEKKDIIITSKDFDKIKKIILYQNIPHYDDSYIDPEVRASMQEMDEMRTRNIIFPTLEEKIAIITAHNGLPKKEQLNMTYRSHVLLFESVCGEIEYTTARPYALYTGQDDKIENYIYKKKKGKFDDYFVSTKNFSKSMGGDGNIKTSDSLQGEIYNSQLNSFNN